LRAQRRRGALPHIAAAAAAAGQKHSEPPPHFTRTHAQAKQRLRRAGRRQAKKAQLSLRRAKTVDRQYPSQDAIPFGQRTPAGQTERPGVYRDIRQIKRPARRFVRPLRLIPRLPWRGYLTMLGLLGCIGDLI